MNCASDQAIGEMLELKNENVLHPNYYWSKILNEVQVNYTTNEKERLTVVFDVENCQAYLFGAKCKSAH